MILVQKAFGFASALVPIKWNSWNHVVVIDSPQNLHPFCYDGFLFVFVACIYEHEQIQEDKWINDKVRAERTDV